MEKRIDKLLNFEHLQYTNRCEYVGDFDLPNISCHIPLPSIDYLALSRERREYRETDCVCFFEYDRYFDGRNGIFNAIYYGDKKLLRSFAARYPDVRYFISPDYSISSDIPVVESLYRNYKARVVSAYLVTELHRKVIPNISFVDDTTAKIALTGIDRGSTVCISTKGLMRSNEDMRLLEYIFDRTIEAVKPSCVVIYTATANESKLKPLLDRVSASGAIPLVPNNLLLSRKRRWR